MLKPFSSIGILGLVLFLGVTAVSGQGLSFQDLPNPGSYEAGSDAHGNRDWFDGINPQNSAVQPSWGGRSSFDEQWSASQSNTNPSNANQWPSDRWNQRRAVGEDGQWDYLRPTQKPQTGLANPESLEFQPRFSPDRGVMPQTGFRPDPRFRSAPAAASQGFRFRGDQDLDGGASPGGFQFRPLTEGDELRRSRGDATGFRPLNAVPSMPISPYDEWQN